MTEYDDLADAMHELRGEVHSLVPVPDAAGLRARATHQLRVRRTATAVVAAAAVAVIAVGGASALRPTASAPVPPADTPTSIPTPAPVTPSPRPAPLTPEPLDDPMVEVDWRTAVIAMPSHEGCPDGQVQFIAVSDIYPNAMGPADSYPYVALNGVETSYGDLTGDGRAEAVIPASCHTDAEDTGDTGDGQGQLLVVTQTDAGDLEALAWVGPRGATGHTGWVVDGYLYVEPYSVADGALGTALRYRWEGGGFGDPEVAPEYPPLVAEGGASAPVWPGVAVASWLGCPDAQLRFTATVSTEGDQYTAPAGGATYTATRRAFPHLLDLDGTGVRLLVTPLACTRADGTTIHGLAVFEPAGDGWHGISVLISRAVAGTGGGTVLGDVPVEWQLRPEGDLSVTWRAAGEDRVAATTSYRWTGTVFEPSQPDDEGFIPPGLPGE